MASKPVGGGSAKKKKKKKQPTQKNPKGVRVKIIGKDGKVRWDWQ